MYAPFFGLKQAPFSIAPDPRYLFMSERHREALAHLLYGLGGGGGFVLLTGEIGAGKTTVCRCFLEQIPPRCNVAYIFNPKLTVTELLVSICDEFRVPHEVKHSGPATVKDYLDPLNEFLLKTHAVGQNNVLIIDEAQNLSADVLEQLRLLTNLETTERKLLQIVLIGQPELRGMLARPELEQLAQRVIARYHLEALSEAETEAYIRHRLAVAGLSAPLPFDGGALKRIHGLTRGVPRRINLLADRALLGAYAAGQAKVDRRIVDGAAAEVFERGEPKPPGPLGSRAALVGIGLLLGVGVFAAVTRVTRVAEGGKRADAPPVAATAASAASAVVLAAPAASTPASASTASVPAVVPAASTPASAAVASASASQPGTKAIARTEAEAWRELAPAWKLSLGPGSPCVLAQQQQVRCWRTANVDLSLIRTLARPGIVSLRDDGGQPVYALLTGLTSQTATIVLGGVPQTVTIASLARLWRGDFATFWRAPANFDFPQEGSRGPQVDALAAGLARVRGEAAPPPGRALDEALRSRISSFQLTQGLRADGLAGPTTYMQLNRATGVDEPRLNLGS